MDSIGLGLFLMAVGMITVFAILIIIIFGSSGIIKLLNKIIGAENGASSVVDPKTRFIIENAISELTSGKGRIEEIKKI